MTKNICETTNLQLEWLSLIADYHSLLHTYGQLLGGLTLEQLGWAFLCA